VHMNMPCCSYAFKMHQGAVLGTGSAVMVLHLLSLHCCYSTMAVSAGGRHLFIEGIVLAPAGLN
jgi:hypothetical protein